MDVEADAKVQVTLLASGGLHAIAVAEQGRTGEVRYVGNLPNKPASIITS
jgi:hypothetical protein